MTTTVEAKGISRREFLYYIWGAGVGLLGIGACGAATWFALPKETEEDSKSRLGIDLKTIPPLDTMPKGIPEGRFWLANTSKGLLVFSIKCTFTRQPCLYKWVPTNHRFECPCCGSKFGLDGSVISGIASRNLDRYMIRVTTQHGTNKTSPDGDPVSIVGALRIEVDTNKLIPGKSRS